MSKSIVLRPVVMDVCKWIEATPGQTVSLTFINRVRGSSEHRAYVGLHLCAASPSLRPWQSCAQA